MARSELDFDNEKITWRIRSDDLAYLRAIFPNNKVNAVVRDLIHLYVERMKARATLGPIALAELYADGGMVDRLSDGEEEVATA